ncbi:hypothetical protein [Streptococcus moroccensis]|uniref:Uncharacterized protein n=1 Tax=Streptococcus moroccensis TaxID=1451356 RepID=A0ABT9YNZ3_9STRE|nr:hypothetical protein [Streptococcus moroccensis]MDQ0221709.1 hypothetical protein [Streptococcus moroccensis]
MVLENKLGIEDSLKLAEVEEKLSKLHAKQLFEKQLFKDKPAGVFETLSYIHDYLLAMERSPIRDIEMKHVLKNALTTETKNRALYMKGADHSYYYEGYNRFQTEEL